MTRKDPIFESISREKIEKIEAKKHEFVPAVGRYSPNYEFVLKSHASIVITAPP